MSLYTPSDCSACWDMLDMLKPAGRPGDPRTQQHAWRAVTACGGSHVCLPPGRFGGSESLSEQTSPSGVCFHQMTESGVLLVVYSKSE